MTAPRLTGFSSRPVQLVVLLLGLAVVATGIVALSHDGSTPVDSRENGVDGVSAADAKARDAFGADGDGLVRFVEREPRLSGSTAILQLRVTSVGAVRATFRVALSSPEPALDGRSVSVAIAGGEQAVVAIAVDTHRSVPGRYRVTAALTSNLQDIELSTDDAIAVLTP